MSIGRLADKLLQRIVPTTQASACVRDYCWCQRTVYGCRALYTDCTGRNCTVFGSSCAVC